MKVEIINGTIEARRPEVGEAFTYKGQEDEVFIRVEDSLGITVLGEYTGCYYAYSITENRILFGTGSKNREAILLEPEGSSLKFVRK